MAVTSLELDHPGLLPAVLVPREDGSAGRSVRDWLVDATCFGLALVLGFGLLALETEKSSIPEWQFAADAGAGALACGLLWMRRRRPVWVGVAVLLLAAVATSASGAGLIAFFTVAVHRRFAVVAAFGLASLAAIPVFYALHPDPEEPVWLSFAIGGLITVAVAAWGMFVRARRQLVFSLRERAERAETEQHRRVEHARRQERARIAREMHDVLAHRISLLSMHAGALEFRPDASPEEVARAAGVIRASAHQALQDLREVIGVLREAPGEEQPERPQPTLADLPALVEESRGAGMHVRDRVQVSDLADVPMATGRNAYRIVQEGLTNARKHARGAAVVLTVRGEPGSGLTVELRNPLPVGRTLADIPGAGTGVVGLAERAHLTGGRLESGRTSGGDYRLWAWLPWPGGPA